MCYQKLKDELLIYNYCNSLTQPQLKYRVNKFYSGVYRGRILTQKNYILLLYHPQKPDFFQIHSRI